MSKQAHIEGHGMVEVIEVKGAWTTFYDNDGNVRKVRNSKVKQPEQTRAGSKKTKSKAKKTKSKKAKAPAPGGETTGRRIASAPVNRFESYELVKREGGTRSYDSGDKIAKALRGMDLEEVYHETARALKHSGTVEGTIAEIEDELIARYSHLNTGMQRMNLGNRLRKVGGPVK